MAESDGEDYSQPVLPGTAATDYERYLNTDQLLALQKGPDEWVHRDELLFQVVHQSSELWLKLAGADAAAAVERIDADDLAAALRLLRRPALCLRFITDQLDMLEQMSPWEYQEIRRVLGHGSGFDSPGFAELRRVLPALGRAFEAARERAGVSLVDVYVHGREHESLYQLGEALVELDEWVQAWRVRHYRVVARVIGDRVIGTQGTPVEVLGRLIHKVFFPELWDVRDEATALLQELLRVNTVNPPGRESAAAAVLHDYFARSGVESVLVARDEGRASIVTRLRGGGGPSLLLLSHTDTVLADPAEWARDPWSGDLVDGEVWGRGALDMKGQVAAGAVALASLAREGLVPAGDLLFASTADEEVGVPAGEVGPGLQWLVAERPELVRADFAQYEAGGVRDVLGGRPF